MMGDLAIAAPETAETEVDQVSTESTETSETTEQTTETTEQQTTEGDKPAPAFSNGKLSESARTTLQEIGKQNPALAKELKSALYEKEALRRILPDGVKGVQELRQQLEQIGTPEQVAQAREELSQWDSLDRQYTSGDPRFLESITDTPEGKNAFLQLAPAVFDKYLQINPDGYSAYVSNVFMADLMREGIPQELRYLQRLIKDNPEAMESWNKIAGYVDRVSTLSQKKVEAKPDVSRGTDDRETQLASREDQINRGEWARASAEARNSVFNSEWARLTAGRKLNDVQQAAIKELYFSRVKKAIESTPNFNDTMERYYANGDQKGFLRYLSSIHAKEVPRALKAAFDAIVPAKPGPKAAPAAPAKSAGTTKVEAGFAWVASTPKKDTIDFARTTGDMIRQGKAVLNDGKKVQWKLT